MTIPPRESDTASALSSRRPTLRRSRLEEVDVVLVPGLAFGPDGRRLGRGAGYYDRFLAEIDADTVGLTTRDRIRSDIPVESHDLRVGWLATEDGVIRAA
jgi:5-formyltetrahydrofolate cyclo-ligase